MSHQLTTIYNTPTGIPELDQYNEVVRQIQVLQAQADDLRAAAMKRAAAMVQHLMDQSGLTLADLDAKPKQKRNITIRYRGPEPGQEWSGQGREPKWMKGKNRDDFRV